MDFVNVTSTKSRCRLCDENPNDTFDIFSEEGVGLNVDSILAKHFVFLQFHNDGIDSSICKFCWTVVQDFNKLYEKTEKLWGQWSGIATTTTTAVNTTTIHTTNLQCEPDFNTVKIEIGHNNAAAVSTAGDSSSGFVHPCVKLESLECDKEPLMYDFLGADDEFHVKRPAAVHGDDDNDSDAIAVASFGSADDSTSSSSSASSEEEEEEDEDNSAAAKRRRKLKMQKALKKELTKGKKTRKYVKQERSKMEVTEKGLRRRNENALNEKILEYFSLDCKDCSHKSTTFLNFLTHSQQVHKKRGFVFCCDRKFGKRCKVLEHISWHTDPESFKCHQCNKSFASKFSHQNHMERHVPICERQFKCNKCTKSFSKSYLLGQHLRLGHMAGSRNFSCDICDKRFSTKHTIKMHIINTHVGTPQATEICYICAKIYKSKASLQIHIMENHNQDPDRPKVQCNICGACFKNELYLKRHVQRHSASEVKCPLCDKVAPSKSALGNHMRYMHVERSHKCSVCEKGFKRAIDLKEHMASHTGQDLYNCHYCTKTFKSNANMHSHRKKAHPIEWNADRIKRFNRT